MVTQKVTRWLTTASVLAGISIVAPIAAAEPAAAGAYGCAGNLSYSKVLYGNRNGYTGKMGTVYDYYDGTYNCSVFVKYAWSGTPSFLLIQLDKSPSDGINGEQHGDFSYYVGPVRIKAPGVCIEETVDVYSPGGTLAYSGSTGPHSCG
ncbi:hypothetical protein [Streptomyces stackebrandtii]|uniref:hypothetical protein n=1 Tax=Streptomyces stackebrandtii TaxID=3051177 RepID=UPI0028DB1AA5|nr:hypothetical protein [Streptomyces sp. DSM 40976]